ncbi:astroprincin family protein [Arcicella sp. DC2W]|uniref:Astroprincin family protein n=1 Tax=Arcicella gelida TaxID=2984195 RepID=A0ABU5S6D4_9BACT|nr:astroprincin family protein [Arcicella sp. DC2W]MEA5404026.1 astroprincin family protein [Arcicella sp. DC2W]
MKLKYSNYFRPILYTVFGLFVVFACQKINPFEDVELTVNTDIYKSPVLLRFVDGNADATKAPSGLKVTIAGPGKDLVLDNTGGRDYTVIGNVLPLVLNKNVNPSLASPIEFTVAVSGEGYVSTSKTIVITSPDDALEFEVPMTNVATPPHGTAVATDVMSLTTGETITVPATAEKPEIAKITIEPGTVVKDESGNVINAKTVETQVVQYGTETEEALVSFPGGFDAENVTMQNGTSSDGAFITGGFVAVDMEADGKKVTSFSKPIEVAVGVSAALENPETGQKVHEGDKIPTWSYDSETGAWKQEGEAIVTKGADGKLTATFKAAHLSYWNLDWFYGACSNNNSNLSFRVTSNVSNYANSYDYFGMVYLVSNSGARSYYKELYDFDVVNGNINNGLYNVSNAPGDFRLQVDVYSREGHRFLGRTEAFSPCTATSIPITLSVPSPPAYLNIDIDFTVKCSNKSLNIKPSTYIDFYDSMNGVWAWTYATSGKGSITLREGREYYFYTYYDGESYWGNVTFGKNSSNIVANGGIGIKGTTSYNATTDRVSVLANYTVNDCE